jgi:hypothetical protein
MGIGGVAGAFSVTPLTEQHFLRLKDEADFKVSALTLINPINQGSDD